MRPPARPLGQAERTRARSGDALLLERLHAAPSGGIVHSVFERVINVAPAQGGLFTLAAREVDDAPDTLVLEVHGWSACDVAPGDFVRVHAGDIVLGERLVVATTGAVPWRPVLPDYPRDRDRLDANLAVLRAALRDARARSGRAQVADLADGLLEAALHGLVAASSAGDRHAAIVAARSMIGLGPGLTPSGDDVLLGLLAAWHLPGHPCERLAACADEMLRDIESRTNAISIAALRAAAAGRVRESIAALLRELVHGTPQTLRAPLSRVLSIGSSSGADIVRGIAAGLAMTAAPPATAAARALMDC